MMTLFCVAAKVTGSGLHDCGCHFEKPNSEAEIKLIHVAPRRQVSDYESQYHNKRT